MFGMPPILFGWGAASPAGEAGAAPAGKPFGEVYVNIGRLQGNILMEKRRAVLYNRLVRNPDIPQKGPVKA